MSKFNFTWEEFQSLPFEEKSKYFRKDRYLSYVLFSQQFDKRYLEQLFKVADKIRAIHKKKKGADFLQTLLSDKRAALYFAQPSTRTFMSFQNACHILGMKTCELRSGASSSEQKGESAEDTIMTFASYTDLIIVRHPNEKLAEKAAWLLNKKERVVKVINAGSGKDQHPTQSLLDVYTLYRVFKKEIEGKTIAIVGDLKRGRAARSLIYILKNYKKIKLILISPDELKIESDVKQFLTDTKIEFYETNNLNEGISNADVVYMTRIQDEYDLKNESQSISYSDFHLKKSHLKIMKKDAIILHPLPRRDEIDIAIDDEKQALYWKQERNGMWIRAALMTYMFGKQADILMRKI